MKTHIFKTLFNENSNESFKLNIYLEKGNFYLAAVENLTAWKASITTDDLSQLAEQHDCTVEGYCDKLSRYFREAPSDVVFSADGKHFYIHKILLNKGNQIKAKYFQCEIEKADYKETVESLLDSFYVNAQELETKFEELQKESNLLQKSNTDCRNKLEEFVYTRRLQEEDLYKNFIIILNEKKKRIQHLTELLEAFRKGRNIINPIDINKKHKRKKQKKTIQISTVTKAEPVSESEVEEDGSTDHDSDAHDIKQEKCQTTENKHYNNNTRDWDLFKPSTSKMLDLDLDILEDDSPTREILLPKRLKRNDGSTSLQNASDGGVNVKPPEESAPLQNARKLPKKEESTPTIDINTQDMVDNI